MPTLTTASARRLALTALAVLPLALSAATPAAAQATAPATTPTAPADRPQDQAPRGVVGIVPVLSAETVGAPAELVIRAVQPHGPAHLAGIAPGDRITAVGGQPVAGRTLEEIVGLIGGEPGATVTLTVVRDGQSRDVTLTRVVAMRHGGKGGHRPHRR